MSAFKILHKDKEARVGELKTAHGVIETPNFIPVGTQGTVKALSPQDLGKINVQVVLANTYHLMLRPGDKLIKKMGGLGQFMGWNGPIMTDSGGFQVFSLGIALEHGVGKLFREDWAQLDNANLHTRSGGSKTRLNKVSEEGVTFQSHLDGSRHTLTPEKSMQIQANLGSDLMVAFDDLESPKYSYKETLKSLELTEKWELRSKKEYDNIFNDRGGYCPLVYGVIHGGVFEDLRIRSAQFVDHHFEGIALGGAFNNRSGLLQVIEWTVDNVSQNKARHLLGIGEVEDLFECVDRGIDLFDCVAPTRRARNGSLYISLKAGGQKATNFTINISQGKFGDDKNPIDHTCPCYTCQNISRAYLRHLYMAKELVYYQLASYHNLYFIEGLVTQIRDSIKNGKFKNMKKEWLEVK